MSSVDQFVQRLSAEVDATTERIHKRQTEAAKVFLGQEQRFMRFVALELAKWFERRGWFGNMA
mgnify:CR=1 FL=1